MSRALREMQLMIQAQKVDLVIETRDARMPLTSTNPAFEQLLNSAGGQGAGIAKRLIVYNKADLAQECFQEVSWKVGDSYEHMLSFRPSSFAASHSRSAEAWAAGCHLYRLPIRF